MEAVIRHDHHPNDPGPPRARSRRRSQASSAIGQVGWNVSPLQATASVPRSVDAFRLIAALFGLTLYLGAPVGLMLWVGTAILR